jgi:hypothetical protein
MAEGIASVAVFVAIPVGVLALLVAHELGHAVPVLLAGGSVHVSIGSDTGQTVTLGRLTVTAGYAGLWALLTYGTVEWSGVTSTRVRAAGIVGGPLVTLGAILGLTAVLRRGLPEPLFWVAANLLLSECYRAYKTVLPRTYSSGPYEGIPSDGKRLLDVLRA